MNPNIDDDQDRLYDAAYLAMDEGRLGDAVDLFSAMLERDDDPSLAYMLGLAHKYRRDWAPSLAANLRSIARSDEKNEAAIWNAAIAATALGDWEQARRLWTDYGITLPAGTGPIEGRFGVCCIRLNPWADGETGYAQRIDPARAVLLNVPLPDSGYRWGDIVLNDGARTGERQYGQGVVPVLNALQLLERSTFDTFAVFASADREADVEALEAMSLPGLGCIEDWTQSIRHLCLRCSYGAPHRDRRGHDPAHAANDAEAAWDPERSIGIAAQSRRVVERLLANWVAGGSGRHVDAIEQRPSSPDAPPEGLVWWRFGDDEEGGDAES